MWVNYDTNLNGTSKNPAIVLSGLASTKRVAFSIEAGLEYMGMQQAAVSCEVMFIGQTGKT